jgi:hypothetical protein
MRSGYSKSLSPPRAVQALHSEIDSLPTYTHYYAAGLILDAGLMDLTPINWLLSLTAVEEKIRRLRDIFAPWLSREPSEKWMHQ